MLRRFITLAILPAFLLVLARGHGLIDPYLWNHGYTDFDFHSCVFRELARSVSGKRGCNAMILGVQNGDDMLQLAKEGCNVTGVEPFKKYVDRVHEKAVAQGLRDKVHILEAAVAKDAGNVEIRYNGDVMTIKGVKLDDLIVNTMDVVSVDVHGDVTNLDVLQGGLRVLQQGRVKSFWVELWAVNWSVEVINLLRQHDYVLFDFQVGGGDIKCKEENVAHHECKHLRTYSIRPNATTAEEYVDGMKKIAWKHFTWMQTDLIAVHKKYASRFAERLMENIKNCKPSGTPVS